MSNSPSARRRSGASWRSTSLPRCCEPGTKEFERGDGGQETIFEFEENNASCLSSVQTLSRSENGINSTPLQSLQIFTLLEPYSTRCRNDLNNRTTHPRPSPAAKLLPSSSPPRKLPPRLTKDKTSHLPLRPPKNSPPLLHRLPPPPSLPPRL